MEQSAPLDLTGLRADNPLGFMAALGCLRITARSAAFANPKLSWKQDGGSFHAVLSTASHISREALISALSTDLRATQGREELSWKDQIKSATEAEYRQAATTASHNSQEWFAAFGSDLILDEEKLESTPLDMSVARQRFLADALALSKSLIAPPGRKGTDLASAYHGALFGPWLYRDDQHSLGWDPSTLKMGAFTCKAPTSMANTGVRAAVWLAFESLPFFPCCFDHGLATRAFLRRKREVVFRWPVWDTPIAIPEVETLLGWKQVVADAPDKEELHARGVLAVYSSAKFKPNKYLTSFRVPELAAGRILK